MDEDAELRGRLAELGPAALQALELVLDAPADQQGQVLRRLMSEPGGDRLAQLISLALMDETASRRLRIAIKDVGAV
jgi:hypothetical protein